MDKFDIIEGAENQDLVMQINNTLAQIKDLSDGNLCEYYPLAFFGIFIKFQNFIYKMFTMYCLGKASSKGFAPEQKHSFTDEKELNDFLGSKNKDYIDYDDRIRVLAGHIFTQNPFSDLFCLSPLSYQCLIDLRNHIAHESQRTKNKMLDMLHGESVQQYLLKKKDGKKNFDKIILNLKLYSDYLIDGVKH